MWHIPEIIFFGKMEGSRKFVLWKTLIVGSIVAALLIYALVENNLMKGNMYKRSMNIFLVAGLTIDLWAVWKCVKQLRTSRQGRDSSGIST